MSTNQFFNIFHYKNHLFSNIVRTRYICGEQSASGEAAVSSGWCWCRMPFPRLEWQSSGRPVARLLSFLQAVHTYPSRKGACRTLVELLLAWWSWGVRPRKEVSDGAWKRHLCSSLVQVVETCWLKLRMWGCMAPHLCRYSYLVDPASSHMLVSKIKPCMSKYIL